MFIQKAAWRLTVETADFGGAFPGRNPGLESRLRDRSGLLTIVKTHESRGNGSKPGVECLLDRRRMSRGH